MASCPTRFATLLCAVFLGIAAGSQVWVAAQCVGGSSGGIKGDGGQLRRHVLQINQTQAAADRLEGEKQVSAAAALVAASRQPRPPSPPAPKPPPPAPLPPSPLLAPPAPLRATPAPLLAPPASPTALPQPLPVLPPPSVPPPPLPAPPQQPPLPRLPPPAPSPAPPQLPPQPLPESSQPLSAAQRKQAETLITLFENTSLEPVYGYAAALGDGRGITFGRAGFTTGTGDGLAVVEAYVKLRPVNNTLAPYLPALEQQLAGSGGSAQAIVIQAGTYVPDMNATVGNTTAADATAADATAANATATNTTAVNATAAGATAVNATAAGATAANTTAANATAAAVDMAGLDGFAAAVHLLANDTAFRQAQDSALDRMYFNASQRAAQTLGLRFPLSKAQLYDAWVQHGEASASSQTYEQAANGIAAWVVRELGGSPAQGVNETQWLEMYLRRRLYVLQSRPEFSGLDSAPRVELFMWLLEAGDIALDRPIRTTWAKCRVEAGTNHSGPCIPQPVDAYALGGVAYGDFTIPLDAPAA